MRRILVAISFTLSVACGGGTTGGERVTFRAVASGPPDATGGPLEFDNAVGYHVTLERAVLHIGAVYLRQSIPISGAGDSPCIVPESYVYVGQVLGGGVGAIVGAAITPSRVPTQVSVFFVAESGGRFRLFHTVRYPSGSWRPADDVLAMNGGTLNGTNFPFFVAAGRCPVLGSPQNWEVIYAMWDDDRQINVGRVVSTPQQWAPGIQGIYPPMNNISGLLGGSSNASRQNGLSEFSFRLGTAAIVKASPASQRISRRRRRSSDLDSHTFASKTATRVRGRG